MTSITIADEVAGSFSGELLADGDDGYDAARKVHNGLIDKRPGLIARCANTADVRDAIGLANDGGVRHLGARRRPQRGGPRGVPTAA